MGSSLACTGIKLQVPMHRHCTCRRITAAASGEDAPSAKGEETDRAARAATTKSIILAMTGAE